MIPPPVRIQSILVKAHWIKDVIKLGIWTDTRKRYQLNGFAGASGHNLISSDPDMP